MPRSGLYEVSWDVVDSSNDAGSIEILLSVQERMEGPGFIGIGWNSQQMKSAEIWFCQVDEEVFDTFDTMPLPALPRHFTQAGPWEGFFESCDPRAQRQFERSLNVTVRLVTAPTPTGIVGKKGVSF